MNHIFTWYTDDWNIKLTILDKYIYKLKQEKKINSINNDLKLVNTITKFLDNKDLD